MQVNNTQSSFISKLQGSDVKQKKGVSEDKVDLGSSSDGGVKLFDNIAHLKQMAVDAKKDVAITFTTTSIKEESQDPTKLNLSAEYPQIQEGDNGFNRLVKDLVEVDVKGFKSFVKEWGEYSETGSYYEMGYNVLHQKDGMVSVRFAGQSYCGGAHPNNRMMSVNYDLKTGEEIKLSSLFRKDTPYFETLSKECINNLVGQYGGEVDENTFHYYLTPQAESFQTFNFTPEGLEIALAEAPHVLGMPVAIVPYEKLKTILDPQGPLGSYL